MPEVLDEGACGVLLNESETDWPGQVLPLVTQPLLRERLLCDAWVRVNEQYDFAKRMSRVEAIYDEEQGRVVYQPVNSAIFCADHLPKACNLPWVTDIKLCKANVVTCCYERFSLVTTAVASLRQNHSRTFCHTGLCDTPADTCAAAGYYDHFIFEDHAHYSNS